MTRRILSKHEIRPATLAAIRQEVNRARTRYPLNHKLLSSFGEFAGRMRIAFERHKEKQTTAVDIYEKCIIVAALAIRLLEEGDSAYPYRDHDRGGLGLPLFDDPTDSGLPDRDKSP